MSAQRIVNLILAFTSYKPLSLLQQLSLACGSYRDPALDVAVDGGGYNILISSFMKQFPSSR